MMNLSNTATARNAYVTPAHEVVRLEARIALCEKRIDDCNWIIFDAPAWVRERDANNAEKELEFYSAELTRYKSQLERIASAQKKHRETRPCPWV